MVAISLMIKINGFLLLISLIILHVLHFRGPYLLHFQKIFRYFTRYERFFMKFLFLFLNADRLYKNRLIRFIPEMIAYFAAKGASPSVYTLQELEKIVNIIYKHNGGSKDFGIMLRPCPCRDAQHKYSTKLPNITDVIFTNNAQPLSKSRDNLFISKDQLIKKLRQFDEMGLVHVVLGCVGQDGYGPNICNCHKSVCFPLKAVLGRDFKRGLARGPSIASCDPGKCKGIDECGKCLSRCPFHGRIAVNGKGSIIPERCFGCGLCANSCESGATQMVPRPGYKEIYFPLNWTASNTRK